MSLLGPGVTFSRIGAPTTARRGLRARRRLLVAAIAVTADAAAALLLAGHGMAVTFVGVASAVLAWVLVGRLTRWQPLSTRKALEDSEERR
ncbi:hypothetical protein [Streptacidiphilus anmyonensis]|uniref:hypothetical protein n=1 Tax=Streptacidiphilus anmyonensis TaxID=405782 RepID=UPI00128C1C1B|nr:hypothetical protein [Streptacidiphilus anmyonensis]